jgi:transposase
VSMHPKPIGPVPKDTVRVAKAAFPKGNVYMQMRDVLGTIYEDEDFSELFEVRGRPAITPWKLALVTVMQFSEGLSDRQAAEAVRARIDWKYALGLQLSDPGFNFSVLSEFRSRLLEGGRERLLLEKLLEGCKERGYLKVRGRQRTDSTHLLGALRVLSKWERTAQTMRAALNALASVDPHRALRPGVVGALRPACGGPEAVEGQGSQDTIPQDGRRRWHAASRATRCSLHATRPQRPCRGRDTAPNLAAALRTNRWRDKDSRPKRDA